jgi:hypothetical protein
MDPSPGLIRFTEVVGREDFPLDYAALLIGAWDYPERDVDTYREQLDSIASFAAPGLPVRAPRLLRQHRRLLRPA